MKILDPGHIYELDELGSDNTQTITFIKRSGGAISYEEEWAGLQTQEVLRALIDRTLYLDAVLPCNETGDAVYHLRMALLAYEARAYRRKQEKANRTENEHIDEGVTNAWRDTVYEDVPFSEYEIERLPTGPDGHIVITKEAAA